MGELFCPDAARKHFLTRLHGELWLA